MSQVTVADPGETPAANAAQPQAAEVEAALGRITLRLVREAEAEAGRPPAAAVTAGAVEA